MLHDEKIREMTKMKNGNLRIYLDVGKEETIKRRSAPRSADNMGSKKKEYCEKFLWPAHEKYYNATIKPLLVE